MCPAMFYFSNIHIFIPIKPLSTEGIEPLCFSSLQPQTPVSMLCNQLVLSGGGYWVELINADLKYWQ